MALGLLGKKVGMTQVNDGEESRVPVTVIQAGPCLIMQKKTVEKDGYSALTLAFGEKRAKRTPKPQKSIFDKLKTEPRRHIREFRISSEELGNFEEGKEISVGEIFKPGQFVDVSGRTKGRGFTGVIKRWGFKGAKASHGTHEHFRHGGSIGNCAWPGKVYKNMKMPGQYGDERATTQNLRVVKVLEKENCLVVEGCVPGAKNGLLEIHPSSTRKN